MRAINLIISKDNLLAEYNCPNCCDDVQIESKQEWKFLNFKCPICDEDLFIDRIINIQLLKEREVV